MKLTVDIKVEPVSWKDDKPLKWRACGTVKEGKRKWHIFGDPRSTVNGAWKSLYDECNLWEAAAKQVKAEMYKEALA